MSNIRRAIFYSSISQYGAKLVGLISVISFARLLTPKELGVFAIASSAILIATELRMFGAGGFLVRENELSLQKVQSAIGLSLLISWSLGLAILFAAPLIASFYEMPPLGNLFRILSISFFLAPFISVTSALLTRALRFKELLFLGLISQLIGFFASLTLVLLGYSYWGLAWGQTVSVCIQFLMLLKFKPENATWHPSFKELKPILKFGSYVSISNMLRSLETTASDLIIGKMGSTSQVAFYSRGLGFLNFLSEILIMGVKPVTLPYLSQVKREGGDLAEAYIKASLLLGAICWPVLAVANIASFPIVMLMFGEQWIESVPIVSILTFWALAKAIHTLSPQLLMSSHNEGIMLWKQFVVFMVTVSGIIISFPYGLQAIALSMMVAGIIDFLINSWAINKAIKLNPLRFVIEMRSSILLTFFCWVAAYLIDIAIDFNNCSSWLSIIWLMIIMPPVWFASAYLLKHPIIDEFFRLTRSARDNPR